MPDGGAALWEAGPPITLSDRGFAYGDGVFETMLLRNGAYWLLSRHLRRLHRGLAALRLAAPDDGALQALLAEAAQASMAAGTEVGVLKLFASAAPAPRGYGRRAGHPIVLRAQLQASSANPAEPDDCQDCAIGAHELPARAALSEAKHLCRAEQVLGAIRDDRSADQELLLGNELGELQCATSANLVVARGRELLTPTLSGPTIAGTLREELLDDPELGLRCAPVALEELPQLAGLWSINSVAGLRPLSFPGAPVPSDGPEQRALLAAIRRSLARHDAQTPVGGAL